VKTESDKQNNGNISLFILATAIKCYVCNATDTSSPFQCGEWFDRYDKPDIQAVDCSAVHGAKYCIKHIGRFEGLMASFIQSENLEMD